LQKTQFKVRETGFSLIVQQVVRKNATTAIIGINKISIMIQLMIRFIKKKSNFVAKIKNSFLKFKYFSKKMTYYR